MAGVERGEQIERLGAAHLADHDPVGPHPQGVAQQVADRHLPPALDPGRAALEADDVAPCRRSSAASSIVTRRSSGATNPERALSRVVLPAPVPPLIRMLRRARDRPLEQAELVLAQRAELEQLARAGPVGAEAANR